MKRLVVSLSPLLAIMAAQPMILSQSAFSQTGAAQSDSSPMANVAGMLGKPAPQFVVMTLDGKQVSLSAYKGKALIVNFWATWCGACRLESIGIGQALFAYKQAAAYAEHMEAKKGRLVAGQFADFVVLDRDPLKVMPTELLKTRVLRTVVGCKTVFVQ